MPVIPNSSGDNKRANTTETAKILICLKNVPIKSQANPDLACFPKFLLFIYGKYIKLVKITFQYVYLTKNQLFNNSSLLYNISSLVFESIT